MKDDALFKKLSEVIDVYIPEEKKAVAISDETDFLKDLNINSAHLVDIILDVEDKFDIEISDEDADQMLTVGNAMEIIKAKLPKC